MGYRLIVFRSILNERVNILIQYFLIEVGLQRKSVKPFFEMQSTSSISNTRISNFHCLELFFRLPNIWYNFPYK